MGWGGVDALQGGLGGMSFRVYPRIYIFDLYLFRKSSTKYSFPVSSRNALKNGTAHSWLQQ